MSNKKPEYKKAKIKVSKEDWKKIKGLTVEYNKSLVTPITPHEMAAAILHLALNKLTVKEIHNYIDNTLEPLIVKEKE